MAALAPVRRAVRAFVIVMIAAAALGCVVAGFVLVIVWQARRELPAPVAVRAHRLEQDVVLVDRYGERMIAVARGDAHREVVPYPAVSPYLRDAVVASEDARFWTHHGIDPHGIARAFVANVRDGRKMQGGSTITQQLLKLLLLQGRPPILRKVEEVMLAERFERLLMKEELLELYLNAVYLGEGNAGVGAIARDRFGISVAEISLAEAALIAGTIAAPSARSPFCAALAVRERQRQVLDQMVAERMVTADAAAAAAQESIRFRLAGDRPDMIDVASAIDAVGTQWPLGVDRVETTIDFPLQVVAARALRRGLEGYAKSRGEHRGPRLVLDPTVRERWHAELQQLRVDLAAWGVGRDRVLVYDLRSVHTRTNPSAPCRYGSTIFRVAEPRGFASGVVTAANDRIATVDLGDLTGTVDRNAIAWTGQPLAAVAPLGAIVDVRLPETIPAQGSTVAVDFIPRPIVEGAVVILNPETRELLTIVGVNEASLGGYNRALRARRPIGSTVKPFVFASAIGAGVLNVSSEAHDLPYAYVDPWTGVVWEPANWYPEHVGTLPLAEAMARSVNMAAIEAALTVGIDRVAVFLEEMSPVAAIPRTPSIALGAFERTPLELARAYAVFANGGAQGPLRTVHRTWRGGVASDVPPGSVQQILDPSIAQTADWLLAQPVEHPSGTARSLAALGFGIRGKTGTTSDARDAWFVGYARGFLVAVWVGYDQPAPLRGRRREESGGSLAVPIAREIFSRAVAMRRISGSLDPPALPEWNRMAGPDASTALRTAFTDAEVMP